MIPYISRGSSSGGIDSAMSPGRGATARDADDDFARRSPSDVVVFGEGDRRRPRYGVCTSAPPSSSAVTISPVAALTSGGPPKKIVPCAAHDHGFVRHRRDVRPARGARTHNGGDLRNLLRGHARLIVENASEMVAIWEDVGLQRQECAARIDEIDTRQVILLCDLLRAQMLLDRHRIVGAAFDGGVVRDDDAVASADGSDPVTIPALGDAFSYIPYAASADSSRNALPGSISRAMRSRAVSLLRER